MCHANERARSLPWLHRASPSRCSPGRRGGGLLGAERGRRFREAAGKLCHLQRLGERFGVESQLWLVGAVQQHRLLFSFRPRSREGVFPVRGQGVPYDGCRGREELGQPVPQFASVTGRSRGCMAREEGDCGVCTFVIPLAQSSGQGPCCAGKQEACAVQPSTCDSMPLLAKSKGCTKAILPCLQCQCTAAPSRAPSPDAGAELGGGCCSELLCSMPSARGSG